MSEPAVEVRGLAKRFGDRKAVDDVTFSVPRGAFLAVFGPNGAGKTTLLRLISTLERPTEGFVCVGGVRAAEDPDGVRARIGVVSHAPMLYPDLTAEENLAFFGELYGVADPVGRARELLDAVGMRTRRLDRVGTFSRGMTQRVSIARALVHDPKVLLLDEPYAGLDPNAAAAFDGLLGEVRDGRTFVMVSHDFERGCALADFALVMARGRSVAFCRLEAESEDPRVAYEKAVSGGVA